MNPIEPDTTFVPISPNPYIVGNPVRDRSMFFGRETEFELVRSRFQSTERGGGLLVFCGERRSGKTSILFQILDKRLGPHFIPVLIDMQSMAISNEADFLGKIAQEVLDALEERAEGIPFPDFSQGTNHVDVFKRFIESTLKRCPDRKLILLFDEYELFENKIDSGVLSRDVLFILNNLMENQSVFLVFTGSQHLDQRRREYWRILGASIWKQISYLEPSDARKLICSPVEGRVTYAEGTVDAIYRLSAGQPFYTQALCQSLVDQLNERKARVVTPELLGEVVRGLVSNPLPQMIFLWDSLESDEKLTLALLAEALPDEKALASDAALAKLIRSRKYPLDVNRSRIATALESLFRAELLAKDDSAHPPSYAFRMDLWRSWIRRMHSAWQVMRELGLDIRPGRTLRLGSLTIPMSLLAGSAVVLMLLAAGFVVLPLWTRRAADRPANPTGSLDPIRNGVAGANGPLVVDTSRESAGARASFGDLRVVTSPAGARVTVDDTAKGTSPVTFRGLRIGPHNLEATLPGHETLRQSVPLHNAGKLETITLALNVSTAVLVLTSEPPGSAIIVDDVNKGTTTLQLAVAHGGHRFTARHEGYQPVVDSDVVVSDLTKLIHFTLLPEPGGELVILGDKSAEFYVDRVLVNPGGGVPNSGILQVARGSHEIRVELGSGVQYNKTVVVNSRERVSYDFSDGRITRTLLGKTP